MLQSLSIRRGCRSTNSRSPTEWGRSAASEPAHLWNLMVPESPSAIPIRPLSVCHPLTTSAAGKNPIRAPMTLSMTALTALARTAKIPVRRRLVIEYSSFDWETRQWSELWPFCLQSFELWPLPSVVGVSVVGVVAFAFFLRVPRRYATCTMRDG